MTMLTYGSLFTGAGGLEMGVQSVLPGRTLWHSDIDPGACKVIEHRWPDVPNLGDITRIDWLKVEPVDVLTGGYPCQPFSLGGKRAGTNDERHLWPYVAEAIAVLRPGLCVFENVRGHLSLGFDEVLRDLHQLGYSVRWYMLRAADIGAPHGRARIFIFAEDTNEHRACVRADRRRGLDWDHEQIAAGPEAADTPEREAAGGVPARLVVGTGRGTVRPGGVRGEAPDVRTHGCWACVRDALVGGADGERDGGAAADAERAARGLTLLPTPRSSDANGAGAHGEGGLDLRTAVTLLPTPRATDGTKGGPNQRGSSGDLMLPSAVHADRWGDYAAAIARWERTLGRPAPDPTKPGRTGKPRLNPQLVEWMMGWPPGHVTAVPGVTDPQALRICGNGVVPQQAAAAARALLHDLATESAA